jgi:hypothetical protein
MKEFLLGVKILEIFTWVCMHLKCESVGLSGYANQDFENRDYLRSCRSTKKKEGQWELAQKNDTRIDKVFPKRFNKSRKKAQKKGTSCREHINCPDS